MSRWLPLVAVAIGILFAGIGARLYFLFGNEAKCDAYRDVTLTTLPDETSCVRVRAQAHYDVVIKQVTPGNLFVEERTDHLFPLFAPDAVDERGIRLLVRTEREPERLVNLETMTVTGRIVPLTPAQVPIGAETHLGRSGGYFFEDYAMVIVPDEVQSGDDVWKRP